MTTIKDVARHARVSVTAASYALNDTGTISEDTRKRILQAAEELNYHPNAFARNLKNRKTLTIGVFITRFSGSFYEDILEGIHEAILRTDYEMIVCPESWTKRKILTHRQVDGAIVFDSKIKDETVLKLASARFPIVVLDRFLESDYLLPLLVDNQHGVKEAFHHLYSQGARRIFFVSGAADSFDNMERRVAFLSEAARHNVSIQCYEGNFTESSGYDAARQMIAAGDLPEAVFCANDQMAIGFIRAMKEHHLKAPDDIAVVGFDDILIARYMQPTLSTIGTSRIAWGEAAATQLIDFLEHGNPFHPHRIPTKLIQRESSTKK
ncbi:MAG: LacI family DNA-binding transcriptional regulator [Chloroflexi bacterium]|nr:LacI family DNA-binding transcriptional regulator [Ardenticatenaceae bacterium]MBL1129766.1 LacI family transcriptional regulator [Chloroflexota bacterium]NOG35850.1 LacI family DNA-binding transcriptional regulator [Chloroflexota bacterium]GIK55470.1 MAG: LacI family transcriptional regulator [Chloroflexota bacterium]